MLKNESLGHKIMISVLLYILVVFIFISYSAIQSNKISKQNLAMQLESTTAQVSNILENNLSNTSFFAYTLSRNSAVQDAFVQQESISYSTQRQLQEYASQNGVFLFLNTGLINIVLLDIAYQPFYSAFFSGNDEHVYDYLKDNQALRSLARQGSICPINRPITSIYTPTYLCAIDVYDTSIQKEGNRRLGTIVLLCSLEKNKESFASMNGMPLEFLIRDSKQILLESDGFANDLPFSTMETIGQSSWTLQCGIKERQNNFDFLFASGRFTVFSATLILLAIPFFLLLIRSYLTRPIDGLNKEINNLQPGGRLHLAKYAELKVLSNYINAVLDKNDVVTAALHRSQSELQELEIVKARTELRALQSQINPHFLYNTLECVRAIALSNGISSIQDIVSAMAQMYQYSIKAPDVIMVAKEIEVIHQYLKIIEIRFSNRYRFVIDIQEEVQNAYIPKMLLQPLVENAVFHGLEKKRSGMLRIRGQLEGNDLLFEVYDNGGCFDEAVSTRINAMHTHRDQPEPGDGIGLLNINRKIKLYYGENYGMLIKSDEASGTIVTLRLPFRTSI